MSRATVIDAFMRGAASPGRSFFTDGAKIHSYGSHYILAERLEDGSVSLNTEKWSVTTSCQTTATRKALEESGYRATDSLVTDRNGHTHRVYARR